MINKKISEALDLESVRQKYAILKMTNKFKSLYFGKLPEISNKNNGKKWDKLNTDNWSILDKSPIFNDKISTICKFLKNKSGNLLDVGFGNGFIEEKLRNSKISLYGIDISRLAVKNLKRKVRGIFKTGSIFKIPFSSNYFNFVLVTDVLEHISPGFTFKAIKELKRVLKINGYLIVSVPLNELAYELSERNTNLNLHVRIYTSEILRTELEIFGFKIIKEYNFFAFRKLYKFKKLILTILPFRIRKPNLLIVLAKK